MSSPQHFQAVVVGSGFGGSVTAYRLAEADRSVLVLERGKAYPPGSFPRSPHGLKRNFWDPSGGLHGMFDLWSFSGLDALVSSGLGGGSLIYANVLLRKDVRWFVDPDSPGPGNERWPIVYEDLETHYERAEQMLGAQRYPLDQSPYDQTPKTLAFKAAAEELGLDWRLPPLAVTFANEGDPAVPGEPIREAFPNLHGRARETCRLCGECDIGCNYGAKNTLDYTYLSAAERAGAEIRTRCEVRAFEQRDGGGWQITYVHHDPENEGRPTETGELAPVTVTADDLILSAGTLGSTYLLLRNRAALPGLSAQVGQGFTGNGDLLTFALRCSATGLDGNRAPRVTLPEYGPVITSAIRVGDELDGDGSTGRGFYLEDAGYPAFVSWMAQMFDEPAALARVLPAIARRLLGRGDGADISGLASDLLGECRLSSAVLPLLGMGRDVPDGVMKLDDKGHLEVDWRKDAGSHDYFERLRDTSRQIADTLGAEFLDNPIWRLNRVITVHALGGARMGRDDSEGVVDPYGRVFNLPGLHVADGSVMPGPVGPNPSLTIAAVADRFADAMLDGVPEPARRAPRVADTRENAPVSVAAPAGDGAVSLAFTEDMKGYCDFGETDYDRAYRAGRHSGTGLMFHLTITADDIDRFISDDKHEALAEGYVECAALGGRRPVEHGQFNLFVDQDGDAPRKRMFYRLFFHDAAGHPLTLTGFKEVRDDRGFDVWSDTSTLYTRIRQGHVTADTEQDAVVLATGILRIHPLDFARQLTTFRTHPVTRVDALARFGGLFAGELWEAYGGRVR
ncbi:MAG: cholesterol oxidase [Solirubrobacteraceae bacterium]|nr:cholesterol oxidase [Solirubrobacteraceae bacterium]